MIIKKNLIIYIMFEQSPSRKLNPINFSQKNVNKFGAKNLKPYVNINGNANNQGYQVQVGTGISNQRGFIGVHGSVQGGWNSRSSPSSPSIGISGGIRF
jgi:hypothetical protein